MTVRRIALLIVLMALGAGPAAAQSPDDVASRISREIMSPFCDGVTLHDCPSKEADELRLEIAGWARAGLTEEQIMARLEDRFGSQISGDPSSPLAWLIPLAALIAGAAIVALLARRLASSPNGGEPPPPLAADDRARVNAALRAHRERTWSG